jgi:hypothetical protein
MPIVNSVYKSQKSSASDFFCPNCLVIRPYEIKPMSEEILLYPIPLMDGSEPSHVIECQVCKNAFDPGILMRHIQSLFRLAGKAKYQLDKGISPQLLKLQLISDGLNERFADQLINNLVQH